MGKWLKENWKTIVVVIIVVVITVFTAGIGGVVAGAVLGTTAAAATATTAGAIIAGAVVGAIAGFAGGFAGTLIYGGNLRQAFKNGFRGALAGAITGAVGGGFGDTWNIGRLMAESGASGVSSEIMGGDFVDGFKVGLVTSGARYLYATYSKDYNTNKGDPHILQDGESNVGKQLDENYFNRETYPEHFNKGNKIIPVTSDQHWGMKFVAKLPGFDSMAEFHDGWMDAVPSLAKPGLLQVTIIPAIAVNYYATYYEYNAGLEALKYYGKNQ